MIGGPTIRMILGCLGFDELTVDYAKYSDKLPDWLTR